MKNVFRKVMSVFLCIALIFCFAQVNITPVLSGEAYAEGGDVLDSGVCGAQLEWVLYDDGNLCIGGTGEMFSYKPGSDYYAPWYSYKNLVKYVVVSDSVTSIGDSAFYGCAALEGIEIPESVTTIGSIDTDDSDFRGVFQNCTSLKEITIPESVENIGKNAFLNSGIYNDAAKWNGDALYIDSCLVAVKSTLRGSYEVENGTRLVAGGAFERCSYLEDVTIPEGVTVIGCKAFNYCESLKTITLPGTVERIGYMAFSGCNYVERLNYTGTLSQYVGTAMDHYTSNPLFYGRGSLYINNRLLTDITANDLKGVKNIGAYTFYSCKSLTRASLPDTIEHVGEKAFFNTGIYNTESQWENGVLYIGNCLVTAEKITSEACSVKPGTKIIADGAFSLCAGVARIHIPYGVTDIGKSAFFKCASLTSLTIPDSVLGIGEKAFENCVSLNEVTLPYGLKKIEKSTFLNCISLAEITIPEGVSVIENSAFYSCGIKNAYLPQSVKTVGDFAFYSGALRDVYYAGSEADRNDISFGEYNQYIENAVWHYGYIEEAHTHDFSVTYEWSSDNSACTATATCLGDSSHVITEVAVAVVQILTPATCTEGSVVKYTADFRKATFTQQTKTQEGTQAFGHTVVTDKSEAATCTSTGLTQGSHCSVCGEVFTAQETVPMLAHTEVAGKAVAPTCTTPGVSAGSRCSVCKTVISPRKTIPATGHADKDNNGFCDYCNEVTDAGKAYPCGKAVIKTAGAKKLDVRTKVTITAKAQNIPSGYYLALYVGQTRVSQAKSDGKSVTTVSYYAGEITNDIEYTVKVISADGKVQKDSSGRLLSAQGGKITCDKGIFKVIAAFFKALFKALPSETVRP